MVKSITQTLRRQMEDTEQALWPLLHVSLGTLEVVLLFVRAVATGQLFYQPVKVKIEKIMIIVKILCSSHAEATCDEPPAVDNAALTNTMATWPIGSTAIYECITNYFFSEDSEMSIVCTDQGVWPGTDNIKCGKCSLP